MTQKVWFITGTSRGFGRVWAEAALERGDQVAATARDVQTLAPLVGRFGDNRVDLRLLVFGQAQLFGQVRHPMPFHHLHARRMHQTGAEPDREKNARPHPGQKDQRQHQPWLEDPRTHGELST